MLLINKFIFSLLVLTPFCFAQSIDLDTRVKILEERVLKLEEHLNKVEKKDSNEELPTNKGDLHFSVEAYNNFPNIPKLLSEMRAIPYFKAGESYGLRIYGIKSGSHWESIGLLNGDIILSIDGESVSDLSKTIQNNTLFKKSHDPIKIEILRGGSKDKNKQILTYSFNK